MILAAKVAVYLPSKMNIRNALARFSELIRTFALLFFKAKCPLGCPCDKYDCDLPEKKAILTLYTGNSRQPVLIQPDGKHLRIYY